MARLNEPVVPTESIESLKRKFLRQNRDIARVNSTQSVQIRNLENEVSNLVAENLSLQEQLSRCKLELEGGRAQRVADYTGEVKMQLEGKLQELSALIGSLGNAPRPKKLSPKRGKITLSNPSQSPSLRAWRTEMGEQEGRLPPILENKSYPRRTLERQEMLEIIANLEVESTDSPEIGPPPVSKFVDEDPVKIDLPKMARQRTREDISGLDPGLSINLEQRRKRKDSEGSSESRLSSRSGVVAEANNPEEALGARGRLSQPEGLPNDSSLDRHQNSGNHNNLVESGEDQGSTVLKTGAKRKMSVREDEELQSVPKSVENPDEFRASRITQEEKMKTCLIPNTEKAAAKKSREPVTTRGVPRITKPENMLPTTRKVLAPKSVNNSPRKGAKPMLNGEAKPDVPKFNPAKERKERRQEPEQIKPPAAPTPPPPETITVQSEAEPETPAGLDLFSPQSSQPSNAQVEARDTPPPSDLGPGNEGQRPSRRARGAVNYAEPNLKDKMRRSTKDLIEAVAGDDKAHRGSLVRTEGAGMNIETRIKSEFGGGNDWKAMPAASSLTIEGSPLGSKASVPDPLPSDSISNHRKRRESLLTQIEADNHKTSSGSAIAALLAETRRAKAAVREQTGERPQESNAISTSGSKLNIYEFTNARPRTEPGAKDMKENRIQPKVSRRHSALPQDPTLDDSEASDVEATKQPIVSSSRRRQSALGMRSSSARNEPSSKEMAAEGVSKRSSSTTGMGELGHVESRSDRVAARRRSMML